MPFKLAIIKCEQRRKGMLCLVIWSILSCVNCSFCVSILRKDFTVIFNCQNLLSLWECFYSSRLDSFVSILRWPLSDLIGNNNGKPDITTTKSNHCQHLNCAIQIGNVEGEQWREGTLWLVIWSIVICVRIL